MSDQQKNGPSLGKIFAIAAGVIGTVYLGHKVYRAVTKKKVFISFDWEFDKQYRHLLLAWSNNKKFGIEFDDFTPDEIQSNNIGRVKAAITAKIKRASHVLVLIGENATTKHKDAAKIGHKNWICFEANKGKELNKKLVAVKLEKRFKAPNEVMNSGASWALSFNFEAIKNALETA